MENPRYDYSPIIDRPPLAWPDGARMAVWVIPNVEYFEFDRPGTPFRPPPREMPEVINYSWRDYGPRVGIWRLMALLDRYGIKATVALNSQVCRHHPRIVEEMLKRGWELMGHGNTNSRSIVGLSDEAEREVIESTIREIREFTGQSPQGWLGPGLGETYNTPDLLAEAGLRYVCDWVADDQPFPMKVRRGSLLAMPYTLELNDIPLFLGQNRTGQQYFEVIRDQFDVLYREGETNGRVMALSLHPFITGVPHRAKYLEKALEHICGHSAVWLARGAEIADWYLRAVAKR